MSTVATGTGPEADRPRLDHRVEEVVERGLGALGWRRPARVVSTLGGGGSGSQVFLLDTGDERVVLKVTEDPAWQERAKRELMAYHELGSTHQSSCPASERRSTTNTVSDCC